MPASRNLITVMALLFAPLLMADETKYKTPAYMTAEDRSVISDGIADYRACLSRHIVDMESRIGDPRALTDAAMELCEPSLTEFDQALEAQNFSPDFRDRYIAMVKKRSGGEALKQAMFMAAQKRVESESSNPEQSDHSNGD